MLTLSIVPSDPALVELIAALNSIGSGAGFRNTERALSALSGAVAMAWQKEVGPDRRIQRKKITPFTHSVYSTDKMVHWLEYGLKPFDMKMTHPYGTKGRVIKPRMRGGKVINQWTQKRKDGSPYTVQAGDPYLIIPFRHRTQGAKAKEGQATLESEYANVKSQMKEEGFVRSQVTTAPAESEKISKNYWKKEVQRAEYSWGSRLQFPEEDKFKNLQGMVVMGSPKQSQFMSFRVVSVNSPQGSWMHPGIKARHYLEKIMERGQQNIQAAVEAALERDLSG